MLFRIIEKELLDNLVNARFIAAAAVSIVLVLSTVVILNRGYEARVNDYLGRVAAQEDFIDRYGHLNRVSWMSRPMRIPSRFEVLVLGINTEGQEENFVSNPLPGLFARLDLVSIVTLVMSLMAVLLSYNAVSGEREAGLLRLMLTTGVSRASILVGKFLGGSLSLLVPFSLGVLAGLLYLTAAGGVQVTGTDLGVLLVLLGAAWLLITAFHALGLFVSARSHTSAESVLKSLAAWSLLVLVIPNISPFLAAQFFPVPSVARLEMMTSRIESEERDQILHQRQQEMVKGAFADLAAALSLPQLELRRKAEADPVFRERYAAYGKAYDEMVREVNRQQRATGNKIRKDAEERAHRQEAAATLLASLSPVADYLFLATDLTETGLKGENRWVEQASAYQAGLSQLAAERYTREREKNPAFGVNDYLDLRDRGRFLYQPAPLGERVSAVLVQAGLLVAFNLLFLAGAFFSFLRYDVR